MDIENLNQPIAGEQFHFRVTGGTRPTHIEVYIDRLAIRVTDCPDPPCHEMVALPHGTIGAELLVIARDTLGNIEERSFTIGDADTSVAGLVGVEV
ncbi:hypothetical protein D3C76_1265730 [compost metagenome]